MAVTALFCKRRRRDVEPEAFRRHMTEFRPPRLEALPGAESYWLGFTDSDRSAYDSVELLTFEDRAAMETALDSEAAEALHEAGEEFVDFDEELFEVVREGATF